MRLLSGQLLNLALLKWQRVKELNLFCRIWSPEHSQYTNPLLKWRTQQDSNLHKSHVRSVVPVQLSHRCIKTQVGFGIETYLSVNCCSQPLKWRPLQDSNLHRKVQETFASSLRLKGLTKIPKNLCYKLFFSLST